MTISNLAAATYTDLYGHIERIVLDAKAAASSLHSSTFLTAEGKNDALKRTDERDGWSADIAAVDAELDRRARAAETEEADALAGPTPPTGQDALAAEMRAARYWARTKPLLDAESTNIPGAVHRLIQTVDDLDLRTVLEEIPAYLAARGELDAGRAGRLVDEALFRRIPEAAEAHHDAGHARTMQRAVFGPLLGYAREIVAACDAPTVPAVPVLKLGQVADIDDRHNAGRAARVARAA